MLDKSPTLRTSRRKQVPPAQERARVGRAEASKAVSGWCQIPSGRDPCPQEHNSGQFFPFIVIMVLTAGLSPSDVPPGSSVFLLCLSVARIAYIIKVQRRCRRRGLAGLWPPGTAGQGGVRDCYPFLARLQPTDFRSCGFPSSRECPKNQ